MPINKVAACEPVKNIRDRIQTDLNIQGPVSCPQDIDMRVILPVYNIAPPSLTQKQIVRQGAAALDGLAQIQIIMLPQPNIKYSRVKLQGLYSYITTDIAGRAAMAVAGSYVYQALEFYDAVSGVYYRIGVDRWNVAASVGVALGLLTSDRTQGLDLNTSEIPAPDVQRILFSNPLEMIYAEGNQFYIRIATGPVAFQLNTALLIQYHLLYE
jgi:hypothetical protein